MYVYDRLLERKVRRRGTPDHVAVVTSGSDLLDGGFETVSDLLGWSSDLGVERVSLYVSIPEGTSDSDSNPASDPDPDPDPDSVPDSDRLHDGFGTLETDGISIDFVSRHADEVDTETRETDGTELDVRVSLGLGGRNEFVGALRQMAREVEDDELDPDDVDEETIERHLVFKGEPDMMITGNDRLSDFMIWQSVYTELYFADFSWDSLRKRDLLRAFREFQDRERRYGK
ncbi:MAG: undecaprenyl diphosphate synthase family protein [Halobacteria archaeon]|nr:undecaprenyl diphosphate synthase family protein [Halobacteria archaeon]